MQIRLARQEDIPEICHIYELAREHMRAEGNTSQWKKYPNETNALEDFANQALYVLEENGILGAFSFFTGEEKNYRKIEGGAWRKAEPYGTIHRVASSGKRRGITKACFSYCLDKIPYLRIDTHENNLSMQAALRNFGFHYCGIVYVEDGSSRLAFDFIKGEPCYL